MSCGRNNAIVGRHPRTTTGAGIEPNNKRKSVLTVDLANECFSDRGPQEHYQED
jgi:hypothetical protein